MPIIYLYIKTHNITGLKYLGKTVQDPFQYRGSGQRWSNHLRKHGNDVSTEILFKTTDKDEFKRVALEYSKTYDIVKSKKFANLMEENGCGGVTSTSFKKGHVPANKGLRNQVYTEQRCENMSKGCIGRIMSEEHKKNIGIGNKGTAQTEIGKKRISESWVNRELTYCPHCDMSSKNKAAMVRWHFDNCKKA